MKNHILNMVFYGFCLAAGAHSMYHGVVMQDNVPIWSGFLVLVLIAARVK